MSRRRAYSEDTLSIMQRFFDAVDVVIKNKLVKNFATFCAKYNIDRRHIYAQKKDLGKGYFEVSWLLPLINDFGVSAQWLLTGKGMMFQQ